MNMNNQKFINDCEELFLLNRNTLPDSSNQVEPQIAYDVMADGIYWNDEGLKEIEWKLSNAFRFVINHRTHLITNSSLSTKLNQQIFELAKQYFPNWIGFREDRCSYNQQLSERIGRIRIVSNRRIDQMFKDL